MTECEAIIEAFKMLGGTRSISEIREWVTLGYGDAWKDVGTTMADMVPASLGGNQSSAVPDRYRVLKRVGRGMYCLIN